MRKLLVCALIVEAIVAACFGISDLLATHSSSPFVIRLIALVETWLLAGIFLLGAIIVGSTHSMKARDRALLWIAVAFNLLGAVLSLAFWTFPAVLVALVMVYVAIALAKTALNPKTVLATG
jgi:hypothetical protein